MSYYYNNTQTYHPNNNYNNYSQYQNWNRYDRDDYNNNGNGNTAMWYANQWNPGWSSFSYRWDSNNNCWRVYQRHNNQYRTIIIVVIGNSYRQNNVWNGYYW